MWISYSHCNQIVFTICSTLTWNRVLCENITHFLYQLFVAVGNMETIDLNQTVINSTLMWADSNNPMESMSFAMSFNVVQLCVSGWLRSMSNVGGKNAACRCWPCHWCRDNAQAWLAGEAADWWARTATVLTMRDHYFHQKRSVFQSRWMPLKCRWSQSTVIAHGVSCHSNFHLSLSVFNALFSPSLPNKIPKNTTYTF